MIFHRLSREDISRIVDVQVALPPAGPRARDRDRALRRRPTLLGNLGYDPTYGARPLKRVIQSSSSTAWR